MITATQSALDKITSLRKKLQMPDGFLKIGLKSGGCSGFIYEVEFTEDLSENDRMVIIDSETEETILVNRKSYLFLNGMEIDYVEDIVNGGFKFKVPDAKTCGCGLSFNPGE
jgi:iron-sulfur cluster assembly protein